MQNNTNVQPSGVSAPSKGLVIVIAILGVIALTVIIGVGIFILRRSGERSKTNSTVTSDKMAINFDEEELGGCSNIFVYKGNSEQTEYITVDMSKEQLGISSGKYTFEIEDYPNYINVQYEIYSPGIKEQANANFPYCNDILPSAKHTSYRAISGKVETVVSDNDQNKSYVVDIVLRNVIFEIETKKITLEKLEISNVNVGWLPG